MILLTKTPDPSTAKSTFNAEEFKKTCAVVFWPSFFAELRDCLAQLRQGKESHFAGYDQEGLFELQASWNADSGMAEFQAMSPIDLDATVAHCLEMNPNFLQRGFQVKSQIEFSLKPEALEEPLEATNAILKHIHHLRSRPGLDTDPQWHFREYPDEFA